jgi:hypothetical protein
VLRVWEHEDPAEAAKHVAAAVRERLSHIDHASSSEHDPCA